VKSSVGGSHNFRSPQHLNFAISHNSAGQGNHRFSHADAHPGWVGPKIRHTFLRNARHAPEEVPAGQLLGCDNEYEFRVSEFVDLNHLFVLDYQPFAGTNLHHADLHFACCIAGESGILLTCLLLLSVPLVCCLSCWPIGGLNAGMPNRTRTDHSQSRCVRTTSHKHSPPFQSAPSPQRAVTANWSSWTSPQPHRKINELATPHRSVRSHIILNGGCKVSGAPVSY